MNLFTLGDLSTLSYFIVDSITHWIGTREKTYWSFTHMNTKYFSAEYYYFHHND